MSRLLKSLEKFRAGPAGLRNEHMHRPFDKQSALPLLVQEWESLRRPRAQRWAPQPQLDLKAAWEELESHGFELRAIDLRKVRTLCEAEETALRPAFVSALEKRPEFLLRNRCIEGMAFAYFARWRTMERPERLEALICSALSKLKTTSAHLSLWREKRALFSPGAADVLAQEIVARKEDAHLVLASNYVQATGLAQQSTQRACRIAVLEFRTQEQQLSVGQKKDRWNWLTRSLWASIGPHADFYDSISSMLLSKSADDPSDFQKEMIKYIRLDSRLGDPRLVESQPNWRCVQPKAHEKFLALLARDNIIFFFNTVLPDNDENRRRKDFWLKYYRAIVDFQVALSEQDQWKVQRSLSSKETNLSYSKVNHRETSAFLMQFHGNDGDYVVAEFSMTGHAAYLYRLSDFESTGINLRTHEFDLHRHLKHKSHPDRIIHNGAWEDRARSSLSYLGIR